MMTTFRPRHHRAVRVVARSSMHLVAGVAFSVITASAWSQAASDAAGTSNDPFVKQREAISQVNQAYKRKVQAAEEIYNDKVDKASQVLDKEVAEARAERKKAIDAVKAGG